MYGKRRRSFNRSVRSYLRLREHFCLSHLQLQVALRFVFVVSAAAASAGLSVAGFSGSASVDFF